MSDLHRIGSSWPFRSGQENGVSSESEQKLNPEEKATGGNPRTEETTAKGMKLNKQTTTTKNTVAGEAGSYVEDDSVLETQCLLCLREKSLEVPFNDISIYIKKQFSFFPSNASFRNKSAVVPIPSLTSPQAPQSLPKNVASLSAPGTVTKAATTRCFLLPAVSTFWTQLWIAHWTLP